MLSPPGARLLGALILPLLLLCLLPEASGAGSVPSTGREMPADDRLYSREYRWQLFDEKDARTKEMRFQAATTLKGPPKKLVEGPEGKAPASELEEDTELEAIYPPRNNPFTVHKLKMYATRGAHEVKMHKKEIAQGVGATAAAVVLKIAVSKLLRSLPKDPSPAPPTPAPSGGGLQIGGMASAAPPYQGGARASAPSPPATTAAEDSETDASVRARVADAAERAAQQVANAATTMGGGASAPGLAFVGAPLLSPAGGAWARRFHTAVSRSTRQAPTAAVSLNNRVARARVALPGRTAAGTGAVGGVVRVGGRGAGAVRMSAENEEVAQPAGFETFFAGLFKKIGASPEDMGMKRFNREKFPELYPATLDEFADLLPTDLSWQEQAIRPMLARTSMATRPLKLAFDAEEHGWDAREFHARCDRLGPGVVIARTAAGAICGGYNPKGWVGLGEYRGSLAAFLYTWPDGDVSKRPIKLRKVGGSSLACVDNPETGPQFGADGLFIPLQGSTTARCKLGPYYERRPDGSNSIFGDSEKISSAQLIELKVYVGVYEEGEEIPYDDAIPFQLE